MDTITRCGAPVIFSVGGEQPALLQVQRSIFTKTVHKFHLMCLGSGSQTDVRVQEGRSFETLAFH